MEPKFIYINNIPQHQTTDIIISDWYEVYAAPYGKSYKMFDECIIKGLIKQEIPLLNHSPLIVPKASLRINTTATENGFCVSSKIFNCSVLIIGLDEAIKHATSLIWFIENDYILTKDYNL